MSTTIQTKIPLPHTRLTEMATNACETAFGTATDYDQNKVEQWNNSIINKILQTLVQESQTQPLQPSGENTSSQQSTHPPPNRYKYCVTSTIVQHIESLAKSTSTSSTTGTSTGTGTQPPTSPSDPSTATNAQETNGTTSTNGGEINSTGITPQKSARRGLHCATGAYWNEETDGMWTFKYEGDNMRSSAGSGENGGIGMDVIVSVIWVAL